MRWRVIGVVAVATVLLFLVGFLVTRDLLSDRRGAAPAASETSQPSPPGTPTPRQCVALAAVDATGQPLDSFWLDQVRAVHDAACRRDYDELTQLMDNPFRRKSPTEVVNAWKAADPDGARLDILSAILEGRGTVDQGGLIFCQKDGIVAFARGTVDRPGKWSEFAIFAFYEVTELTPTGVRCA